jgi:hypothetical protein
MYSRSPNAHCCFAFVLLQIGESLKRFGATETTKHLLVARFDATPEDVSI